MDWLYASLEAGDWVGEEPYELVDFSPAVRNFRVDREKCPKDYQNQLFKEVGTVYISKNCKAPQTDLTELVSLGGGSSSNLARVAKVVVGELAPHEGGEVDCVTEKWLLDSVQFGVIMPFTDYPLI